MLTSSQKAQIILVLSLGIMYFFLIFIGPVFSIWSLNQIFNLNIPLTFSSWCAMAWFHVIFYNLRPSNKPPKEVNDQ